MKIFIVGCSGSTGKRYCRICRDLGHEIIGHDINDRDLPLPDCDRAIVASPTETHVDYCKALEARSTRYLCEKPVTLVPAELKGLTLGECVCNWAYVIPDLVLKPGHNVIYYDYCKTGPHRNLWDVFQLIMLGKSGETVVGDQSKDFNCVINDRRITLDDIEQSYQRMLEAWLRDDARIWKISDTLEVHEWIAAVIKRQEA